MVFRSTACLYLVLYISSIDLEESQSLEDVEGAPILSFYAESLL